KPAAPSRNAPKQNAIRSAWMRRSGESATTEALTISNSPVYSVRTYKNTAARTIQPMGNRPKHAPKLAAASADFHGMPKTAIETTSAVRSPAAAARGADQPSKPSEPSSTTTGAAASSVERNSEPVEL